MRNFILLILILTTGCESPSKKTDRFVEDVDIRQELAAIEVLRAQFEAAIKEGRYEDLRQFTTPDAITVGPGNPEWAEMRKIGTDRGRFPYDSIRMFPSETVIVSDSIAYDFGTSIVYYTNREGELKQLHDTFLVILKKGKDKQWRLHREVASSTVLQ